MRAFVPRLFNSFCSSHSKVVTFKIDEQKKTAKIVLSNPKKRNTLSSQAIGLLKQSLSQIQKKVNEKKVKIVVLQGEGTVFSSGHDLKQISKSTNPKQIFQSCAELVLKVRNFPVPTLCSINGIAAAAGFQLALACDLIVATEKSTFSCPGVKWGLFCSTPAVELIRRINSQKKAMEMLLFGESISAQQAYQYGLVNRVVPENKLEQTINEFVTKANNLSGQVITLGKNILRNQKDQNVQKAYCIATEGMLKNIKQKQDCQEGLKSFAEKRHPHFKN